MRASWPNMPALVVRLTHSSHLLLIVSMPFPTSVVERQKQQLKLEPVVFREVACLLCPESGTHISSITGALGQAHSPRQSQTVWLYRAQRHLATSLRAFNSKRKLASACSLARSLFDSHSVSEQTTILTAQDQLARLGLLVGSLVCSCCPCVLQCASMSLYGS